MPTINVQRWSTDHECCIGVLNDNGVERTRAEQIVNGGNPYIEIDGEDTALSVMQGLADCGCVVHLIGLSLGFAGTSKTAKVANTRKKKAKSRQG